MPTKNPSNAEILTEIKMISSQVGEVKEMAEGSYRTLRGTDENIGLVARVIRNEERTAEIIENTKVLPELVQSVQALNKSVRQMESRPCREEGRIVALEKGQTQLSGMKESVMTDVKKEIKDVVSEAVSPDHVFRMEDLRTKLFWPVTFTFTIALVVLLVMHNINPLLP